MSHSNNNRNRCVNSLCIGERRARAPVKHSAVTLGKKKRKENGKAEGKKTFELGKRQPKSVGLFFSFPELYFVFKKERGFLSFSFPSSTDFRLLSCRDFYIEGVILFP